MMREQVTAAVRQAAEGVEYAFWSGFEYRINATVTQFPAVWMAPPKLVRMQGRNEGSAEYTVELQMMAAGAGKKETEKEAVWSALERDAVRLCRRIEETGRVRGVELLECVPGECSLTAHGELSIAVRIRVGTAFCMCEI